MEFPVTVCITRDRTFALHLRQAIGMSCARITTIADAADLGAEWCGDPDLLLVDGQLLDEEPRLLQDTATSGELILVAPAHLDSCIEMMASHGCSHIIGGNPMASSTELLTTIRKTRSFDIFGLKKYVPWGGYCYESRVASLIDKRNAVSWVATTAHRLGCARWMTVELEIATEELLSNAIYPDIADPEQRFEAGPTSSAVLRWACTDGCIHVSVTDERGTFDREALITALRELARPEGDELALLGLPRQITLAQRLVVNVVPGMCTEVIVSIPLRGRKTPVPSIGFFSSDVTPDQATASEPVTINLSGRLVVDTIGLTAEVSIRELDTLSAEVTVESALTAPIYPGLPFELMVNVPFHGELRASGLIFRVEENHPVVLSLSFATGYQDWERIVRSVLGRTAAG
jgi:anti-sigma regulatory factor (Ser/Thr protein kinase)